jgi:iron complex outermembrane receptor protein
MPSKNALRARTRLLRATIVATALLQLPQHPVLAQQAGTTLDTVAIVASRAGSPVTPRRVDVITRDDIARSPARTVADLLQLKLGVDIDSRSPAQSDLSIRGSSPEQVLILVDGVRVSDAQSAHYALDLAVPVDAIERIEILRGAGSSSFGPDAVGGVVNIVTRAGAAGSRAEVNGGGFGTAGAALSDGRTLGAMSLNSSANYEKSDGFRAGTDYRNGQARVSLSDHLAAGTFRAALGGAIRDFGASDFYGPYNSVERTGTTTLDAHWDMALGGWSLSSGAGTRRHTDLFTLIRDHPAIYQNLHETWQTRADVVARHDAGPVALALGLDAAHDQLTSNRLGGRREWRAGAFAEGVLGRNTSASLTLGLRGDKSSDFGSFFSPSLGVVWQVAPSLQLAANGARSFRAPNWTERFYSDPTSIGNPELQTERFWTGDVSARVTESSLTFDVTAFVRSATDLIDWVKPVADTAAPWRATNVGTATYRGIESRIEFPALRDIRFSVFGSGLSLVASQGDAFFGKYALRPLTRKIGAQALTTFANSIDASLELVDARRSNEDGYVTANARLAYRRGPARVSLDLMNLTNASWLDASAEPVMGRAAFLHVSWSVGGP